MSGALPAGACDAHCHVFGPASRFPYDPARTYTPGDAPREALLALHARLGIARAVIVQPAAHGLDNGVTLDAIAASGNRYRGIALVPEDAAPSFLAGLDRGGIRGVRYNFVPHLSPPPSLDAFRRMADRIAPFDWHIVLHAGADSLETLRPYVEGLPVPAVIDHMGRIDAGAGLNQAPFAALLDLARDPNLWIKISGADRASATGAPWHDAIPFARAIVEAAPDRTLWGTDWPHPNVKGPVPDDAALLGLLRAILPEPGPLRAVLVDNPERLYRFEARPIAS